MPRLIGMRRVNEGKVYLRVLAELISKQHKDKEVAVGESNIKATKYGCELFKYFCNHEDRSKIII